MNSERIRIGKIVGHHGLRGDVKVRPSDEAPNWVDSLTTVFLGRNADAETLKVEEVKTGGGSNVRIRFQGLNNREAVERLLGRPIYASRQELPEPENDEYWADDLIGLSVIDFKTRQKKGTVKDLLSSTGSDFLEIELEGASDTVIIPFIDRFFPEVSLEEQCVYIDLLSDFIDQAAQPS